MTDTPANKVMATIESARIGRRQEEGSRARGLTGLMVAAATRDVDYATFLESKRIKVPSVGRNVSDADISPVLYPFQRDLVRWAARKGRAALFVDTGMFKTGMQLEWARLTGRRTLILAPLVVSYQTADIGNLSKREIWRRRGIEYTEPDAAKRWLDSPVTVCKSQDDVQGGINITNYERLHLFDPAEFGAIVLNNEPTNIAFLCRHHHRQIHPGHGRIKLRDFDTAVAMYRATGIVAEGLAKRRNIAKAEERITGRLL